ncbi:hypothetical protein TNCV_3259651 [Trichonephila clavipes]|nr:hypothetical protein TNCV_3259651 [Trichonephila clavipes]
MCAHTIGVGKYYECWEKSEVGFRPQKREGLLYCEPLSKRLVTETHGAFSGAGYAVKLCVRLGKTAKKTHDMIKEAYGGASMGISGVFEWHKMFQEGRERGEDDDHLRTPFD